MGERISPHHLPDELHSLAATFNEMLDGLEQAFSRLSRFSADIAHELRTPIANLRGEVEVALREPRAPDEYRDVLQSNLEECARLTHIIERLLFLARAENPETQIAKDPCDLGAELKAVCEFYEPPATQKGVQLTIEPLDTAVVAALDRPLFQRAIGNLIANAIAHTPAGGSVRLIAREEADRALAEVIDTGCGIKPEHLPHIFDRFYRADTSQSSGSGNVGLGLAIVRSIVELHGGTVSIESQAGRGTRVILTFQRSARPLAPKPLPATADSR